MTEQSKTCPFDKLRAGSEQRRRVQNRNPESSGDFRPTCCRGRQSHAIGVRGKDRNEQVEISHRLRMMRMRLSTSSIIGFGSEPISWRKDSLATAIIWPRSRSLSRETPPWPFFTRIRRIPGFSTSRVVVGMTIVEGYSASLTRSDWSTRAGRSFPGLVLMRGLKSMMYKCPL